MNHRHMPKHFEAALKSTCKYCHKTPALWHYVGPERICVHCGTRVYNAATAAGTDAGSFIKVTKDH